MVRHIIACALVWMAATGANAQQVDWAAVTERAKWQTVYFNAWGGDERINDFIDWAAGRVETDYAVEVEHVALSDTADAVSRVLAEKSAGRQSGGSVDLIWINGENFRAMKEAGLLYGPFVDRLPNAQFIDTVGKPTTLIDFTIPTDGLEAPWGMAQLVFQYDTARVASPPRTLNALLSYARDNPGRVTYPAPPDFIGVTFLKQALISLTEDPAALQNAPNDETFDHVTAPLWAWLDAIAPHLWRGGTAYPISNPVMRQLLDDGEIDISFSFNPGDASSAIAQGLLPDTVRTFVLDGGTIGNTHFLAIPFNANAPEGALVLINFLLSPEAQARKANPDIWGDPTVLDVTKLPPSGAAHFAALPRGIATLPPEELGSTLHEPDPRWMTRIELEWKRRYAR